MVRRGSRPAMPLRVPSPYSLPQEKTSVELCPHSVRSTGSSRERGGRLARKIGWIQDVESVRLLGLIELLDHRGGIPLFQKLAVRIQHGLMIAGDQFVLLLDGGTGRHPGLVDRHLSLDFFLLRGSFLDHLIVLMNL